jgi:dCTP deaminase
MVVLSDREIKSHIQSRDIIINQLSDDQIGSCSIDLRLGNSFRVFRHAEVTHIDPKNGLASELMEQQLNM